MEGTIFIRIPHFVSLCVLSPPLSALLLPSLFPRGPFATLGFSRGVKEFFEFNPVRFVLLGTQATLAYKGSKMARTTFFSSLRRAFLPRRASRVLLKKKKEKKQSRPEKRIRLRATS